MVQPAAFEDTNPSISAWFSQPPCDARAPVMYRIAPNQRAESSCSRCHTASIITPDALSASMSADPDTSAHDAISAELLFPRLWG
jgi:hypothetical protein